MKSQKAPQRYTAQILERVSDGQGGYRLRPVTTTPLLSAFQAAEIMSVNYRTVYRLCEEGRLNCVRVSKRCLRIKLEDVMSYMKKREGACAYE